MPYKFFHIPAQWPEAAEADLNAFLARHMVQTVDRQFIAAGAQSAWSLCVVYTEGQVPNKENQRRSGTDYRELLSSTDFDVFAELRRLRKRFAEEQAVPPYTVFSNEQLAAMVTRRVRSLEELRRIDGIGQSRCERYGEVFLELLRNLQDPSDRVSVGRSGVEGGPA